MTEQKEKLSDRMKAYENISRIYLTKHSPVIIRIDGRAFHTLTRGFKRPFDELFMRTMQQTALRLCQEISNCKFAYVQSDEISILLTDFGKSQPWFGNNLQKLVSVSASIATLHFNRIFKDEIAKTSMPEFTAPFNEKYSSYFTALNTAFENGATFDARAFVIPENEIRNYFIWRQRDAIRNSIQMLAQSEFPRKELFGKNCSELIKMLHDEKNIDWSSLHTPKKQGCCITKNFLSEDDTDKNWVVDINIPDFIKNTDYINNLVYTKDIQEKED